MDRYLQCFGVLIKPPMWPGRRGLPRIGRLCRHRGGYIRREDRGLLHGQPRPKLTVGVEPAVTREEAGNYDKVVLS